MALKMMKQINSPDFFKLLSQNNNNNSTSNKVEKVIPDYLTIDTESNPLNKYIENAINISYIMKLEILKQKNLEPDKFVNISEVLSMPGLLSDQQPSDEDYKYILCLIGKILENNGITVGIYKENDVKDRIDLSAIQFIFSGLINKKNINLNFLKNLEKIIFFVLKLI